MVRCQLLWIKLIVHLSWFFRALFNLSHIYAFNTIFQCGMRTIFQCSMRTICGERIIFSKHLNTICKWTYFFFGRPFLHFVFFKHFYLSIKQAHQHFFFFAVVLCPYSLLTMLFAFFLCGLILWNRWYLLIMCMLTHIFFVTLWKHFTLYVSKRWNVYISSQDVFLLDSFKCTHQTE